MKDLQIVNEQTTALADATNYKDVAVQWLTSTGKLKDFNESEKNQFIDMCCAFQLNPIKREVYGIKYKGKNGFPDTFNIVIGYEVYLKRAERTGKLDGFNVECKKLPDGDMVATATIYRKDWSHPFVHSVLLSEYHQHNKMWNEKPVTMIKKVVTEQAFRLCFPDEMGGLPYGEEELPQGDSTPSEPVFQPSPKEKNITPSKESADSQKSPQKKYTKEQASKLAELMNAILDDGTPAFSQEEKDSYKSMLVDGLFDDAYSSALDLLKKRDSATTVNINTEIDSELN